MEFIGKLKEAERIRGHRRFHQIDFGRFSASIQASEYNYCTPRKLLDDPTGYSKWECAIFEDDKWLNPHEDARFERWRPYWEDDDAGVGGYVPTREVEMLLDKLAELAKEE